MAFKDVFKGFFAYEDEEVYVEEQSDKVREPAQKKVVKETYVPEKRLYVQKVSKNNRNLR